MPVDRAEVKLDLDRKWSPCKWTKWCERAAETLNVAGVSVKFVEVRETQHGFHAHITLDSPMPSDVALVALQAALGSDGVREALNLGRALQGRLDDWNSLSEVKAGYPSKGRFQFGGVLVQVLRRHSHPVRLKSPRSLDMEASKTPKRLGVS